MTKKSGLIGGYKKPLNRVYSVLCLIKESVLQVNSIYNGINSRKSFTYLVYLRREFEDIHPRERAIKYVSPLNCY